MLNGFGRLQPCHVSLLKDFIEKAEMLLARPILRKTIVENARGFVKRNLDCSRERSDYAQLAIQLKKSGRKTGGGRGGHEEDRTGERAGEGEGYDASGSSNAATDCAEKKVRFRLPSAQPNDLHPESEMPSADQASNGSNPEGEEIAKGGWNTLRKLKMKSPRVSISFASDVAEAKIASATNLSGQAEAVAVAPVEEVVQEERVQKEDRVLSSASSESGSGRKEVSKSCPKEKQTNSVKKRTLQRRDSSVRTLQRRDSSPLKTSSTITITTSLKAVDTRSPRSPSSASRSKANVGVKSEDGGNRKPSSSKISNRRPSGGGTKANVLKRQASQKSLK